MIPLDLMQVGEAARIVAIDGDPRLAQRLEEMGLREGAVLRMVRRGTPCIVAVNDHRISFRGENAAAVLVEPIRLGIPESPVV